VTATSDRRRGPQAGNDVAEWGQRSAFGATRGWPWWAAVLVALVLSIAGAIIDMHFSGNLSKVFDGAYFIGCVIAVCFVRRRNVFGPMVQAPLILAVTVPVVVVVTKGLPTNTGLSAKLIALGVPLVTGFPTMAITTIATVLIGGIRFLVQRKPHVVDLDDDDRGRDGGRDDRRRPDRGDRDRADRDRGDRDRADRYDRDADDRSGRSGADRRQRPAGSGRPGQDRAARDDRGAPRDRTRMQPPSDRGDAADRGRGSSGRSSADRDRDPDRDRDRGQGQAARGGQSRERGGQPQRGARPSRDDARRQSPRRRDDDY